MLQDIRNPDLLSWLVGQHCINQYGSEFDKETFDPEGLPEEDKIGALSGMSGCEEDGGLNGMSGCEEDGGLLGGW